VSAARSNPPTPRARSAGHAAQQWERAARTKERRIRRRECPEQYNEEYRLREQQGLSPLLALANSLSDEEEESYGGQAIPDTWEPAAPSPRAEEAAVELVPAAGEDPPAVEPSEEALVGATKAPASAAEVPPSPRGRGSGDSPI
jgi:hypothetical protein